MKEILLEKDRYQHLPYSLHDAEMTSLRLKGENVEMSFRDGITLAQEPFPKTGPAAVEIRGIDPDFCFVTLLKTTEKGKAKGKRMSLVDFLGTYPGARMTLVSELHGYNCVQYSGCMFRRRKRSAKLLEVEMEIYFFGDLVYRFRDEA